MDAVLASAVNDVVPAPGNDATVGGGAGVVAIAISDIDAVRRFLVEVGGVQSSLVDGGSWDGRVGNVQGRFARL